MKNIYCREECFKKEIVESGRDLGEFEGHLSNERAYMCRTCKDLYVKLENTQQNIYEWAENAIATC